MHPILEELTGEITRVRTSLASVVATTPADKFDRRPQSGGWSGTGIIAHLGKTEGMVSKLLEGLFATALADGIVAETRTGSWLHSLDRFNVLDRNRRIEAPERVHPAPDVQFAPSWTSLQSVRERLLRAVATVDGRDLTAVSAPHPIFGALNGYEWILIVGKHEERHLSQLRETLSEA
ncbi:MAG: DinB family protein [Gemmatimonadales bacterium]